MATLTLHPIQWVNSLFDDAYYYLGIAKNIGLGHGSKFALPLDTNGYHPLWLTLIAIFSTTISTDTSHLAAFLHGLSALCATAFIFIAAKQHGTGWAAALTILAFPFVTMMGMETALIAPLALLFFRSNGWTGGLLGSALFLARLDALSLVAGKFLYEIITERKIDFRAGATISVIACAYFLINHSLFGTFLPVSGQAKAVGNIFAENWKVGLSLLLNAAPIIASIFIIKSSKKLRNHLNKEIAIILIAICVMAFYYGTLSGWNIWPWYRWTYVLLLYFLLVLISRSDFKFKTILCSLIAGYFIIAGGLKIYSKQTDLPPTEEIYKQTHQGWARQNIIDAEYFNSLADPKVSLIMGDRAGSLGYFLNTNRHLIQSEGLVADRHYLHALKNGTTMAFLEKHDADYLIIDRARFWKLGDIFLIPEPIQGISAKSGVMLRCFPPSAEFNHAGNTRPERKYFRFASRIDCPDSAKTYLADKMKIYGGVRNSSLRKDVPTGFFKDLKW